jgi:Transglutaminase-like superfamily
MLRSLGIPARLVTGYGPGTVISPEAPGRHVLSAQTRSVTTNDAHSWVEAYFPHYGWVPFEPTPPSQLGNYQPFLRAGASTPPPPSGPPTPKPSHTAHPTASAKPAAPVGHLGDSTGGPALPRALAGGMLGGLGALIVAVVAMAWFVRPRSMGGVWRRVGLLGRALGVRRDRSLTYDEYARRVGAAVPPDSAPAARRDGGATVEATRSRRRVSEALLDIALLSYRSTYGADPPPPDDLVTMRREWRRIARLAPRLGWHALRRRSATP